MAERGEIGVAPPDYQGAMRCFLPGRVLRLLAVFAGLALSGCFNSAVFLNRGYLPGDVVEEDDLVGRWGREPDVDEGEAGEVAKAKANRMAFTVWLTVIAPGPCWMLARESGR